MDTPESFPARQPPPVASSPEPPIEPRGTIDALLRRPAWSLAKLDGEAAGRQIAHFVAIAAAGLLVHGVVVGSFSGGAQWWAAPVKLLLAALLCGLICLPSLFVFATLAGASVRVREVAGVVAALFALVAIFMASVAPVAWVLSQSATLTAFVGALHLVLWAICAIASKRVLDAAMAHWGARPTVLIALWVLILLVTSFQMLTTLRPIVGSSEEFFDGRRKFFLVHWGESLSDDVRADPGARSQSDY